jgi:uncharacterized protein YwqG
MTNIFSRWFGKKPDNAPVRDVAAPAGPLAAPAVHIVKTKSPSLSHFDGLPNLPPEFHWPEHKGRKLGFVARLSLSEIQRANRIEWLPSRGALLFFYDMEEQPWGYDPKDRGSSVVLLAPDLPAPISQQGVQPDGRASPLSQRNIAFRRIDVLPSLERNSVRDLELSERESDLFSELTDVAFSGEPKHQIAGFPAPIQGDDMELECQLVTNGVYCGDSKGHNDERAELLKPGAMNWRLLLQVDSDDALDVMWGDAGVIYYWVEEHAAREGRFENTWLILQCH